MADMAHLWLPAEEAEMEGVDLNVTTMGCLDIGTGIGVGGMWNHGRKGQCWLWLWSGMLIYG